MRTLIGSHADFVCDDLKRVDGALCEIKQFVPEPILCSLIFDLFHSHVLSLLNLGPETSFKYTTCPYFKKSPSKNHFFGLLFTH